MSTVHNFVYSSPIVSLIIWSKCFEYKEAIGTHGESNRQREGGQKRPWIFDTIYQGLLASGTLLHRLSTKIGFTLLNDVQENKQDIEKHQRRNTGKF